MEFRKMYEDYKSEIVFGLVLLAAVLLSFYGSHFIPYDLYKDGISQILNGCVATIGLFGAILMWRHHGGIRARRIWALVLLGWSVLATMLLMRLMAYDVERTEEGVLNLRGWELVIGNFYAWSLLLYPAEVLRPGWLNLKRSFIHLLPVFIVAAIDYFFHVDLRWLLALYPVVLMGFLAMHIRAYRTWCEQNYSSLEDIDVQWIVRYMIMYLIIGGAYIYMSVTYDPTRAFTLQWLLLMMLTYSTEQILFRRDPWRITKRHRSSDSSDEIDENEENSPAETMQFDPEYREILDKWMETEKPYTNPEFRLLDLRQVLPLNRTYMSTFINVTYGCNFYQFVTNYRIQEAKRLMTDNPGILFQDVSERSGFSSPTVFSRVFAREVGMPPRDWLAKENEGLES